jgi:hypothetical protein
MAMRKRVLIMWRSHRISRGEENEPAGVMVYLLFLLLVARLLTIACRRLGKVTVVRHLVILSLLML